MKKIHLNIILFLFIVVCNGYAQSEQLTGKTLFLVGEFNLGIPVINSNEYNKVPADIGINIGFDKKLSKKSGLGLHLFINTSEKIGVRARVSQYTKVRKKMDVSFGVALNSFKSYLDVELNYYFKKDLAIYSRLEFNGHEYTNQKGPKRILNLGLKMKAPKLIAATAGGTAILLGILMLQGIANSN